MITKAQLQETAKKTLSRAKCWLERNFAKCLAKTIIVLAKLIIGACIWFFMGELVPELRKALPHFYQIVDALVNCFDRLAEFVINRF